MLSTIIAISVSTALLIWILNMKKDDPFPKWTVVRLLIAGVLSCAISGFLTIIGAIANFIMLYGTDIIQQLMTDPEGAVPALKELTAKISSAPYNPVSSFIRTFLIVGFVEEICKFLLARSVIRKKLPRPTWKDVMLCFLITALGFQISEDIGYSEGSVLTAIVRALTPFHFTFAAVMGYYWGRAKQTGNGIYCFLAIFIPSLLHTLFDFSIKAMFHMDIFLMVFLGTALFLFVLTIVMILKIRKWNRTGILDIEVEI